MLTDRSISMIEAALHRAASPYIAVSGGKDSLVVQHLVHRVDDSIEMVYCDDELLHPEHIAYMGERIAQFGKRLRVVSGGGMHRWHRP